MRGKSGTAGLDAWFDAGVIALVRTAEALGTSYEMVNVILFMWTFPLILLIGLVLRERPVEPPYH